MRRGFSATESSLMLAGIVVLLATGIIMLQMPAYLPLLAGLMACAGLAMLRGFSLRSLAVMAWDGTKKAIVPIEMMALIGVLMGLWRLNGTAAAVAAYGSALVWPGHFALSAFLICSVVSMAVGTANGAAGIIGLPLMMAGQAAGFPQGLLAGAIISGVYLGDRSSPVSSVLHMTARLTGIGPRALLRRAMVTLVPAAIVSATVYSFATPDTWSWIATDPNRGSIGQEEIASNPTAVTRGVADGTRTAAPSLVRLLSARTVAGRLVSALGLPDHRPLRDPSPDPGEGHPRQRLNGPISPAFLLAPALMLVIAVLRVPIVANLSFNVLVAAAIAAVVQRAPLTAVARTALLGYHAQGGVQAGFVPSGGGLTSMTGVLLVLMSSTALSGVLSGTEVFDTALGRWLHGLTSVRRIAFATMGFSIVTGMVAANQALSVVLPCTLLRRVYRERGIPGIALAHAVSDSGVIAAPLVPWSVAALGPAAILGVSPWDYLPYAFLCWTLPVAFAAMVTLGRVGPAESCHVAG